MAEEKAKELRVGDRVMLSKEGRKKDVFNLSVKVGTIMNIVSGDADVYFESDCIDLSGWISLEYIEKVPEENKEWCKRCGAGDPFTMFPNDACYRCGAGVEYATDVKPEEADKK